MDCINGLEFVITNEENFRREIIIGIITLILSYILKNISNRIYYSSNHDSISIN